jgi:DedD protein
MPFFNFRRASSTTPNAPGAAQPESMEVVRKRAKHRLIGTAVLVLAGVVGFPLLFDTQPRPIAVDIPIEIPSKNTVKPLVMLAKPDAAADLPASTAPVAAASSLTPKEEIVTPKPAASPAAGPVTPAPAADKNEAKPVAKADVKADDGARARALLDGQAASPPASAPAEGRMVVQVGAFADANKAKEVRQRLEKAGLKTYTQVAETKEGKRIRVRVGPFATKAEADNAASKIKTLDLPASILTL